MFLASVNSFVRSCSCSLAHVHPSSGFRCFGVDEVVSKKFMQASLHLTAGWLLNRVNVFRLFESDAADLSHFADKKLVVIIDESS